MVSAGGALAAALLVFGVIVPLDRSVAHVHERVGRKQADLLWMRGVAASMSLRWAQRSGRRPRSRSPMNPATWWNTMRATGPPG